MDGSFFVEFTPCVGDARSILSLPDPAEIMKNHRLIRDYLGAQAGEARLASVFAKTGFSEFRKAKATPFNLILEAKV